MCRLVHKSTITVKLEVQDGVFEERYALTCERSFEGFLAVKALLPLIAKRNDALIVGFSWALKDPSEVDQFSPTEVVK